MYGKQARELGIFSQEEMEINPEARENPEDRVISVLRYLHK